MEQALEARFLHHFPIWPSRWWNEVGRNLLLKFYDNQLYTFVGLETVDDDLLRGFDVNILDRTVKYRQPDIRQIRDFVSAGSLRLRLGRLKSRAHLIRKYTYPPDLVFASVSQLGTLYVQKGFNQADVYQALQL